MVGTVTWHGRDAWNGSAVRYSSPAQLTLREMMGRIGYRVRVRPDDGSQDFFCPADNCEVLRDGDLGSESPSRISRSTAKDDRLLARAIPSALRDRQTLALAYAGNAEMVAQIQAEAVAIEGLTGRRLRDLGCDELRVALQAFVYGEQHEVGYADNHPGRLPEKQARALRKQLREARLRLWGETGLESKIAGATGRGTPADLVRIFGSQGDAV